MQLEKEILNWYVQAGVTETIGEVPQNRFNPKQETILLKKKLSPMPYQAVSVEEATVPDSNLLQTASQKAAKANTLEELKDALISFDGCSLKKTAKNTVFGQGNPYADVMFIGEAPGADEDRLGLPFVGVSGQLLDKMMLAVGLSRQTNAYISNIIPWRPPGNRNPSSVEIALCMPFIQRHIELVAPKLIIALGGTAFSALINTPETISKARGNWHSYQSSGLVAPVLLMPVFHPAFLLRTPAQKKNAWRDFLNIRQKLDELSAMSDS